MKIAIIILLIPSVMLTEPSADENEIQCGVPHQQKTLQTILKGSESTRGMWPWHIALIHKQGFHESYKCGGTLISKVHVLTAAHCLVNQVTGYQQNKGNLRVDAGAHDLNQLQHRQRHTVKAVHTFDNFTQESHRYDIAILELDSEVKFNQYVKPACVFLGQSLTGKVGTVVGWGRTEFDATASTLRQAQLPVVDLQTCLDSNRDAFGPTLEREMFCAGHTNGTGVCNGDSGGGLVFEVDGAWHLGGIVSFTDLRAGSSSLCQTEGYSVFTGIHPYLPWIRNKTGLWALVGDGEELKSKTCTAKSASAIGSGVKKLPRHCGVYYPNRVVMGQVTKAFEFPWMALLVYEDPGMMCIGSLIHSRYVLTAAHCIIGNFILKHVLFGEHTIDQTKDCNVDGDDGDDCAPPVRAIKVACFIIHPDFSRRPIASNDIALVKLAAHVTFEDHIQPICLPTAARLRVMEPSRYIITGWGGTDFHGDEFSKVLMKGTVPAATLDKCQEYINKGRRPYNLTEKHICAGGKDVADICMGDSGAPLGYTVRFRGIRFIQFGIALAGRLCGTGPSIYTNVSSYMNWILANIDP